jgi:hypothetical protein
MTVRVATAFYLLDLIFRTSEYSAAIPLFDAVLAIPFAIALPYGLLRELSDRDAIGLRASLAVRHAISVWVGFGFGLRVVFGVLIGSLFMVDGSLIVLLFVAASLMGSAETMAI